MEEAALTWSTELVKNPQVSSNDLGGKVCKRNLHNSSKLSGLTSEMFILVFQVKYERRILCKHAFW